jgi:hypothetical protein
VFPSGQNRALVRRAKITDRFYTLVSRVERAVMIAIKQKQQAQAASVEYALACRPAAADCQ